MRRARRYQEAMNRMNDAVADGIAEAPRPPLVRRWLALVPRGGATIVGATVVVQTIARLASSMFLTRLLDVPSYGILGILASVQAIFQLVSDLGILNFVVRHKEGDDPRLLDQVWTVRLIRSLVLTVAMVVLSWPIAAYVQKPEVQPALAATSLIFLIDGLNSMTFATEVRAGRIARLSIIDMVAAIAQVVVAATLVLVLRSVWGVILAMIVTGVIKSALSYTLFAGSRRRWALDRARVSEMWAFSRYITGSSILTMLLSQTDKVVLSRLFPLDMFGLYVIAANIALSPSNFTFVYSTRVLYPIYARAFREAPETLRHVFYSAKLRIGVLYMIGAGGLVGGAPMLIRILYDPRYAGSALYLRLLAIGTILTLGTTSANELLIAVGRVWTTMTVNILRLGWLAIAGFVLYMFYGPVGLVVAVATIELPAQLYSWYSQMRAGVFDARQELLLLGAAAIGVALGLAVNQVSLRILPA